jgi:hypothetical protein
MTSVLSASGKRCHGIQHTAHFEFNLRTEAREDFHHARVKPFLVGVQRIPGRQDSQAGS